MYINTLKNLSYRYIAGVLAGINLLVRGINSFHYPVFTEDEGTYASQALALLRHGDLAYYTYWYDHAPFGWMLLALWRGLLQMLRVSFEYELYYARSGMVVLSCASLITVVYILRSLAVPRNVIIMSALVYIFSPLNMYYQRSVFLDNIMIFWILLSLFFTLKSSSLKAAILSGLCLAFALLSKETAIFFVPFYLYLHFASEKRGNRRFTFVLWAAITTLIVSLYPLFALLKGELFPAESFLGNPDRVSLLDTLLFQNGRSDLFWEEGSALRRSLRESWLLLDPLIIIAGVISVALNLVLAKKSSDKVLGSFLGLGYIFYLLKWQAFTWYIIPLIPLFIISLALLLHRLQSVPRLGALSAAMQIGIVLISGSELYGNRQMFTQKITDSQLAAIEWLKAKTTAEDFVVIDNYAYSELNDPSLTLASHNFHYFWKVEFDEEIRRGRLGGDLRAIDYLVMTQAMQEAFLLYDFEFLSSYLEQAEEVARFGPLYPVTIYQLRS